MLILFDQAVPLPCRSYLKGHLVRTAAQQSWSQMVNGTLLAAAEKAGFDLLLTTDGNMQYQQNLTNREIAIVVLTEQQWPRLRQHMQLVVEAVNETVAGSFRKVHISAS